MFVSFRDALSIPNSFSYNTTSNPEQIATVYTNGHKRWLALQIIMILDGLFLRLQLYNLSWDLTCIYYLSHSTDNVSGIMSLDTGIWFVFILFALNPLCVNNLYLFFFYYVIFAIFCSLYYSQLIQFNPIYLMPPSYNVFVFNF